MSAKFCGARFGKMHLTLNKTYSELKTPLVKLHRAAVTLGDSRVLHDLDWTLAPGENWALFGANGSGKTTFLRLIAGQQWPVAGNRHQRIYNFGNGPEAHAVYARQNIRLVSPELHDRYHRFNWNPTAWALIATGLADSPILRIRPDDQQVEALRDLTECLKIGSLINRRFLELSRGEQRKLLLARAVIGSPRILLLDEICDGLDQSARHQLLSFIDELAGMGVQLVFASHRRQEIPRAINRYVLLRDGGIAETGTPADLGNGLAADLTVNANAEPAGQTDSDASESALIAIENADLYRGDVRVLTALNWQLQPGQSWLIRGANGSGKSTLIKLLHAEMRPALGGQISWFGVRSRANVWRLRQRLGLVSDELQSSYSDSVTVQQCVATGFFASIGRIPFLDAQQRRYIDEWLEMMELDAIRAMSIHQLSYGQFRRVLIARALVQHPEILLLDEPMSGLDSESIAFIWSVLSRLSAEGTALVMTSHEAEISGGIFSHRLTLKNGRAVASRLD
jgi:molybdate transport system ATP-binding protein